VINDPALLGDALAAATRDQGGRFVATQRQLFNASFDLTKTPSAVRAAHALTRVLGQDQPASATTQRPLVDA
jgi:hypothetical protein